MATGKPARVRSSAHAAPPRAAARTSQRARPRAGGRPKAQEQGWRQRLDPARVAFIAVLVAVAACAGLLLDVYTGKTDSVHLVMLRAFGPLAFLVPVGLALLVMDFYRRHDGHRPWLRFEESCGALLLFIATLTLASLSALSSSLIGDTLSDELAGVLGRPGAVFVVLTLLAVGAVLAFRVTPAHMAAAYRVGCRAGQHAYRAVRTAQAQRRRAVSPSSAPARARGKRRNAADTAVPDAAAPSSPLLPPAVVPQPVSDNIEHAEVLDLALNLPESEEEPEADVPQHTMLSSWHTPQVELLDAVPPAIAAPANNDARARIIEQTLASFNVSAEVVDVQAGPTVTQFGLRPAPGVRVQRITALANDLALALAAPSIRIEAPVPGRPIVGIEIPNGTTALVTLREILESDVYARMKSPLKIALGKNVSGDPVAIDLARMPHLLIAGATGSGKSVCLNSLIACLLFSNSPERLRLLMIDPKMVELTTFNGVPHLLRDVVTEMDKVSGTLKWALKEMHRRYKLFGEAGARNIARYNELQNEKLQQGEPATEKNKPLPYIVFIIDELADLMMVSPAEVEDSISRLAALARATGIHLVLATQRPSVDVITGVIKANFPARIAFAVSSQVDSRTILDQAGAEKLMGRGDMLYLPSDGSKAMRVQGTYLSDKEIERLVEFWKTNSPYTLEQIPDADLVTAKEEGAEHENEDKLFSEATKVVREYRRASVSLLQRRLSIGYSRAARLLDQLEERGVVGPSEDGRSRVVIETEEEELVGAGPGGDEEVR